MALKTNPTQDTIRKPVTLTRGHVALVASFIGVAGLLAGVVGFLWTGGLDTPIAITLGVGAVGIALWALATPADFIGFVTGRRIRYGTFALFSTMLLIAVVAMVFLFLGRAAITLDMTVSRSYSLTPASMSVINRVARPLQITGFYTSRALPAREIDDQFFRLYSAANENITRVYIDPNEQPALADRFGVTGDAQVFISYLNPDGSIDFSTLMRVPITTLQEREMTGAISRLLIAGTVTVYLDQGLGERDPLDGSQEGIAGIYAGMRETGFIVRTVSLAQIASVNGNIPPDAAAFLLIRPTVDLDEAMIGVLDRYLARGGTLLILTDPLFNENPFMQEAGAFNQYLREKFGIYALDAIVVDADASAQTPLDIIGAHVNAGTDISERLIPTENPLLFRIARAVQVDLDRTIPNVANGLIVRSSDTAYGEKDWISLSQTNTYRYDEGVDLGGSLPTVVYATNQSTGAKIVLIGDSDFVSNGLVTAGGNGILFTDAMTWLTSYEERLNFGIRGFSTSLPLIFVSSETREIIAFSTIIILPVVVLLTGAIIWTRRVRRR